MLRTILAVGLAAALAAAIVHFLPDLKRYIEVSKM